MHWHNSALVCNCKWPTKQSSLAKWISLQCENSWGARTCDFNLSLFGQGSMVLWGCKNCSDYESEYTNFSVPADWIIISFKAFLVMKIGSKALQTKKPTGLGDKAKERDVNTFLWVEAVMTGDWQSNKWDILKLNIFFLTPQAVPHLFSEWIVH